MNRKFTVDWGGLFKGLLLIALGLFTINTPRLAISGLTLFFGLASLLFGLIDLVMYAWLRRRAGAGSTGFLVKGSAGVLAGLLLLLRPGTGRWILSVLVPVVFIAHCISRLVGLCLLGRVTGGVSAVLMALNALGLLAGLLVIFNPLLFTMSLGFLLGVGLTVLGISEVTESFGRAGEPDAFRQI